MVYDLDMLKAFYASFEKKIGRVRAVLQRPLTLAEKILYTHLYDDAQLKNYERGEDYVNFRPDRVAMQDATAQMALLQFINAGKDSAAVPSTVHCDHLIQAYKGAGPDIATATETNREVYDFLRDVSSRFGIGFWKPGAGIIHQVVLENYAFPGGNDGGDGFSYPQCRRIGNGGNRSRWCRCCGCNDRYGMGVKDAETDWSSFDRKLERMGFAKGCDSEIGRYSDRERWNECHYRIFWRRDSFTFGNR